MHPADNNLQDSCLAWGLLRGCGDAGYGTSTPGAMLGCRCREVGLPGVSCPHGCERQPLCLLQVLLHLSDCSAEGAKREQLEGLSMVLVVPLNLAKGRKEADGGEWS